ncbi:hypothetical protein FB005_11171 [Sinorhizobium medicae]|nr:hypothetical protein FB006_11171 [Sinorhizobium medicae]TWA41675.1 hypothetical protein FB005_11171 [Sinorhizobium medicae]
MDRQREKQRQGRAEIGRVPAKWQGRQSGGGNRYLAGENSFGRLRLKDRARHAGGPFSPFRPVFGKPNHRALKRAGVQIAAALRE